MSEELKICHDCKLSKCTTEFHRDVESKDRLYRRCKSCTSIFQKARYRRKMNRPVREPIADHARHGLWKTPEYRSWAAMVQRCEDVNCACYKYYGGNGITVCPEWRNSFLAFYRDIGPRPAGTSLDRIDGTNGYYSQNCRWATSKQQNRNKCNNRNLTYNGVTQSVAVWAEQLNMSRATLATRLHRGWTDAEVLTTPIMHQKANSRSKRKSNVQTTLSMGTAVATD